VETSGCVFLEQADGQRGCGLHRAALLGGFSPIEIKPEACSLYPLELNDLELGMSSDYPSYSCATETGPTVYRQLRATIGELFGEALVEELDRLEAQVARRNLRVLAQAASGT